MNKLSTILFWLVMGAYLLVFPTMIIRYEGILNEGVKYKFRTGLRDPFHPFQGRYVVLGFEARQLKLADPAAIADAGRIYLELAVDAEGFAEVINAHRLAPAGDNYLEVTDFSIGEVDSMLYFSLPFEAYYMNEKLAPQAEELLSSWSSDSLDIWAQVSIKSGEGIISGIYVEGSPLEELVKESLED